MTKEYHIFAYKYKDEYTADSIVTDLEKRLRGLEYGDVVEKEYQIWEYPSGKIYSIVSDRTVDDKQYYSTPDNDIWMPILIELGIDQVKVTEAYNRFIDYK